MPNSHYEELTDAQCWDLLDATRFGRLATCAAGEPDIFPVNFLVEPGKLLMRTAAGTKLAELTLNSSVAVETDGGRDGDAAWSVVLKGQARMVEGFTRTYEHDTKQLQTWLPNDKPIYVEITAYEVTGRRFLRGAAI